MPSTDGSYRGRLPDSNNNLPTNTILWPTGGAAVAKVENGTRTAQNATSFIETLPPELLIMIFRFLAEDSELSNGDVFVASHVCQRWRAIATGAPDFWTEVWLDTLPLAAIYLERSRPLPITVFRPLDPETPLEQAFAVVKPHINRMESLTAALDQPGDLVNLARHIAVEVPMLHTLTLQVDQDHCLEEYDGRSGLLDIFPNVRDLSLANIPSRIVYAPIRDLNSLSLYGVLPPLDVLLTLLRHCPTVTNLALMGSPQSDVDGEGVVELPRLQAIVLSIDPPSVMAELLSCLSFSPHVTIIADFDVNQDGTIGITTPLPHLDDLSQIVINWVSVDEIQARGWRTSEASRGATRLQLHLAHSDETEFVSPLPAQWPIRVSYVRVLEINVAGKNIQDELTGLDQFPHLQTLRLVGPTATGVVNLALALSATERNNDEDAMDEDDDNDERQDFPKLKYCPRLANVEIKRFTWSAAFATYFLGVANYRERLSEADKFSFELFEVRNYVRENGSVVDLPHGRVSVAHGVEEVRIMRLLPVRARRVTAGR